MSTRTGVWICAAVFILAASGCGDDEEEGITTECDVDTSYQPAIDAADFVAAVDNPLFPLAPGTTYTYAGGEDVTVEVTATTRVIMGITCTVVRDTVREGAEIVEDTFDWYAQDLDGNVWYFGEDTREFEGGEVVSTEGSWEAGVDGAQPGIVMPGAPFVGSVYRQEYYACHAEDAAEVIATNESVSVPFGNFNNCLRTRDYTPLDLLANEYKWYCPNVGFVAEVDIFTGTRVELNSVVP